MLCNWLIAGALVPATPPWGPTVDIDLEPGSWRAPPALTMRLPLLSFTLFWTVGVNSSLLSVHISMCIFMQLLLVLRQWKSELCGVLLHLALCGQNMKIQ
jgi:hypothetical protein